MEVLLYVHEEDVPGGQGESRKSGQLGKSFTCQCDSVNKDRLPPHFAIRRTTDRLDTQKTEALSLLKRFQCANMVVSEQVVFTGLEFQH